MPEPFDSIKEPVPISLIAGRYLLFDVNVVTYLRRTHRICGMLTGTIPQIPQQNVFLGLPVELMPEEARLLVEKDVAYIIDDTAWHKEKFNTFEGSDQRRYLDSLRSEGLKARRFAECASRKRSENALARIATHRRTESREVVLGADTLNNVNDTPDSFFNDEPVSQTSERPLSSASTQTSTSNSPWPVTLSTTCPPLSLPQNSKQLPDPPVPSSYPLFAHLHSRDYYLMPGLRFGCDYNVYPGDPLRFHSHFAAVSYGWNEEISMLDLIGGGRLGTRVKKGFLIGGYDEDTNSEGQDSIRTFCIEWGGM